MWFASRGFEERRLRLCAFFQRCQYSFIKGTKSDETGRKRTRSVREPDSLRSITKYFFLGIIVAGGVFSGTNPSNGASELQHHFQTARVQFVNTEPDMLSNITTAAEQCNISTARIWIFDVLNQDIPSVFQSWKIPLTHGGVDWDRFDHEQLSKETTAARLFVCGAQAWWDCDGRAGESVCGGEVGEVQVA
jgi:hypothetical protein